MRCCYFKLFLLPFCDLFPVVAVDFSVRCIAAALGWGIVLFFEILFLIFFRLLTVQSGWCFAYILYLHSV